jgi:hypothetical protein
MNMFCVYLDRQYHRQNMTRKAAIKTLYDHPSDMEPLLPGGGDSKASAPALALIRGAERLRVALHPITRKLVTDLVLMTALGLRDSGQILTPRSRTSTNPANGPSDSRRAIQAEMEAVASHGGRRVCSLILCWLHEGFYRRCLENSARPNERKDHEITGKLRKEVSVGRHGA